MSLRRVAAAVVLACATFSGTATAHGGAVFAVDDAARVRRIGGYQTPGGADETSGEA